MKNSRKKAWEQYKESRTTYGRQSQQAQQALNNYNILNNTYRNYFKHKQIEHEKHLVRNLKTLPKLFHQYIRNKKVGVPSVGPLRLDSGELTSDCTQMSNIFATNFCSVYTTHVSTTPSPHQVFEGELDQDTINLTLEKVSNKLKALDPNTSMGPDGVHPNLLKSCPSLSFPIYLIYQKSLATSQLPKEWKRSNIVPIFKKGSRYSPLNYRPISLTSICCKTLERFITEALYNFLDMNNLFSDHQYGFRHGRTVDDQLLLVYDNVTAWLDAGYIVDVVLFDFSKAFDIVSHPILIDKLKLLGIKGPLLSWIADFLQGRTMHVTISGCTSAPKEVLSGVPQGSVLGPLLFLVYINFLPSYIHSNCKIFADDMKMYLKLRQDSSLATYSDIIQRDIETVYKVANSWGLRFNTDKCAVLRCQRGYVDLNDISSIYHMNNTDLSTVPTHKDLGIIVDNTLKFHSHISTTVRKAAGLANNLLKSTLCRDSDFMLSLYISHIRPLLEFGSTVWNTGYQGDLKLLESVQRRWTKEVYGLSDLSYGDRLKNLNLYSVKGRLLRADLIKMWKIFNNQSPIKPSDLFIPAYLSFTRGHRFKIAKPHTSIECRRRFFSVRIIDIWNSLPDDLVSSNSLESYKKYLHMHLGQTLFEFVD